MLRNRNEKSYYNNICQIKVNKRDQNNSINNNNSPPHQENNYYYNTKINSLILQESSNNSRSQNIFQQSNPSNNNIFLEYDFLANNLNNIIPEKKPVHSLYKKILNQNFPITVKKVNDYYKDINGFNCVNNNGNINNYIQSSRINYNNDFRNIINFYKKYNEEDNSFQGINNIQNSVCVNLSQRNSNKNFYNFNNDNNSNYSTKKGLNFDNNNISNNIHNNSANCKKIPIKKGKIGNYYIKNTGMPDESLLTKNNLSQNKQTNYKYRYKSPEIIIETHKAEKGNFNTIQKQNNINNIRSINIEDRNNSVYKSFGSNFYPKMDERKINNNNNIIFIKQENKKDNININYISQNNNNKIINKEKNTLYNNINNNNLIMNAKNIFTKIQHKKIKIIEIPDKNEKKEEKQNYISNNREENKKGNLNILKNFIKNKLKNYNLVKKNIDLFCEILEQFYFISFKKNYNYFIKNLISFNNNKNSNRAIILLRFKDGKKSSRLNDIKENNNTINLTNNNNRLTQNERLKTTDNEIEKEKDILIENYIAKRKKKSPSKFVELQNNLTKSMMKMNEDNYIKIFDNIFNKKNKEEKRCNSPFIERGNNNHIRNNNSIKSFDCGNEPELIYDKYNTNTNINVYFQKKNINKYNNLKINTENSLRLSNNENIMNNNYIRKSFNSLKTDNDNDIDNNIFMNKRKNSYKIQTFVESNNYKIHINSPKHNDNNIKNKNSFFYGNNIFQKQNYKIQNSKEPFNNNNCSNINIIRNDSEKKIFKKKNNNIQSKKNILYAKPLLKKTKTKCYDKEPNNNNKSNNYNLIKNLNYSKNINYSEKINNLGINGNEIIIKNVKTEDERLHVFIKYIILENIINKNKNRLLSKLLNLNSKKENNFDKNKLKYNHTDTITIISNYEENYDILKKNNSFYKKNKDNKRYTDKNDKYLEDINYFKNLENKNLKNLRHKTLTSIGEEEEKTKNKFTINNTNIEEEANNNINNNTYINEVLINSTKYLISLLQNKYDDNKKSILFNFFKNLRKIKTSSLLYTSLKSKGKKNLLFKNKNNFDNENNNNSISYENKTSENLSTNNTSKKFTKVIKKTKKNNDLNENIIKYNVNTINTDIKRNIKKNKNEKIIKKEEDNILYNTLEQETFFTKKNNYIKINKSYNKLYNNISFNKNVESNRITKKDDLLRSIKKVKEEGIKKINNKSESKSMINNDKNKNKDLNNDEKEIMKQKKLAKLGKLFNNLNKENNIINAIKEQFLDWTNKNDFPRKPIFKNNNDNDNKKKDYEVKTFDIINMFNKKSDDNETYKNEFGEKIKIFRNKIIFYFLKNDKKKIDFFSEKENNNNKTYDKDNEYSHETQPERRNKKYKKEKKNGRKKFKSKYEEELYDGEEKKYEKENGEI